MNDCLFFLLDCQETTNYENWEKIESSTSNFIFLIEFGEFYFAGVKVKNVLNILLKVFYVHSLKFKLYLFSVSENLHFLCWHNFILPNCLQGSLGYITK